MRSDFSLNKHIGMVQSFHGAIVIIIVVAIQDEKIVSKSNVLEVVDSTYCKFEASTETFTYPSWIRYILCSSYVVEISR